MRDERIEVDGIPGRLHAPDGATGLLLLGHGGARSKDSGRFVDLSRTYAERTGLAVVCIDAVDHGERAPANGEPGLPARWHSSATEQMVADWHTTADALASIGPPVAYVGFSMGSIFGAPTVASMPSIAAAVFVVGGIPTGMGIDDPPLRGRLLDAAAALTNPQVLMVNLTHDDIFAVEDVHELFDAVPGRRKRLMFWAGEHDEWPEEAIDHSVAFIVEHTA